MTRRTVTLMQELPLFLRGCTVEELYQLARALRHDLARRGLVSTLEADALLDTLLLDARVEHQAIFSADCSTPAAAWSYCTCTRINRQLGHVPTIADHASYHEAACPRQRARGSAPAEES